MSGEARQRSSVPGKWLAPASDTSEDARPRRLTAAVRGTVLSLRTACRSLLRRYLWRCYRDSIQRATAYGIDVTLLAANLRRTPAERLRQLDAMIDFQRRIRRGSVPPSHRPADPEDSVERLLERGVR